MFERCMRTHSAAHLPVDLDHSYLVCIKAHIIQTLFLASADIGACIIVGARPRACPENDGCKPRPRHAGISAFVRSAGRMGQTTQPRPVRTWLTEGDEIMGWKVHSIDSQAGEG
jgi:hypothetical protein